MAFVPISSFTSGQVLTAAQMNELADNSNGAPRGRIVAASQTTSQSGIGTTATDLTGLSVTFTATSSRFYRITLFLPTIIQGTGASGITAYITDSSNNVKGDSAVSIPSTSFRAPLTVLTLETGLSGSITRKGRLNGSADVCQMLVSATSPAFILVEDLGSF